MSEAIHICIYPRFRNGVPHPKLDKDRIVATCHDDVVEWMRDYGLNVAIHDPGSYELCVSVDGSGWTHYSTGEWRKVGGMTYNAQELANVIWGIADFHMAFIMDAA